MAVITIPLAAGANHATVVAFQGFSVQEDAGAAAVIEFRQEVVGGLIVWYLNLDANKTGSIMFPTPISTPAGLYVKEVSGSVSGVIFSA